MSAVSRRNTVFSPMKDFVGFACVGCVRNIILGQFLYGSKNRVGTACAKCRMKRKVVHQMSGDILDA